MKRPKRKRKYIPLQTRLAAALLQLPGAPSTEEAKGMTDRQIISRFDLNHDTEHALGGKDRPYNLTWMIKAAHAVHTAKVSIPRVAKVDRNEEKHAEFRRTILRKKPGAKRKPRSKIPSRPFARRNKRT